MFKNIWMLVNTAFVGLFVACIIDSNTYFDPLGIVAVAICFGVEAYMLISDVAKYAKQKKMQKMAKRRVLR